MGYYIFSYGIETDKTTTVFNSNDENILKKIKGTETFANYKGFLPKGAKTSPEKALEDIIKNRPYDKKSGFAYGYAVICICDALGNKLPYTQEIKAGYETDLIDKYLSEAFGIKNLEVNGSLLMTEDPHPYNIPSRDFPIISLLSKSKLLELDKQLEKIEITDEEGDDEEDEDKACAYTHIKGIKENIKYCVKNNLEMINFCH